MRPRNRPVLSGPGFVVVVSDNGDGSMWFFYRWQAQNNH